MRIKGQKIYITRGDSFDIPFILVADENDVIVKFEPTDEIFWVLKSEGCSHPLIVKKITGIDGNRFVISVGREESKRICEGKYEYGMFVKNGEHNRLTIVKPTDFIVERGV